MDQLDFKIFKSMGYRPYGPNAGDLSRLNPWVIAKKVGADGKTVKTRLNKMIRSGFIKYFQIYPNYRLLGINDSAYAFRLDDVLDKNDIIDRCSLVDGVTEIHNFIGTILCIDFTYQDSRDESRRLDLFRNLTRCDTPVKFYDRYMPEVDVNLNHIDWQIIKALRYDAFKPLSKIARELGLTAKTVRKRFERMAQNNAVIIVPIINPSEIPDTITHTILLYPSPSEREEVVQKALEIFEDSCFLVFTSSVGNTMICLAARTLAETEENLIRARKIKGMMDAKLLVLREIKEYTQWIDSAIDRKIAETTKVEPSMPKIVNSSAR
jgi:DNA-binding Lrp family transcriptional regulator